MNHKSRSTPQFLLIALCALATLPAQAEVKVPRVFSDHAVLQRSEKTPVWGTASPSEKITVSLGGATSETTADDQGKWIAYLNLQKESEGPSELTIAGSNTLKFSDILVGEVWLCSGQSNMRFHLTRSSGGDAAAAQATDSKMRFLSVGLKVSDVPMDDIKERWTECDPKTAGEFSAVGYYFGRELRSRLNVPIGLISVSWAATCIEEWMPPEVLASDPDWQPILDRWKKRMDEYPAKKAEFDQNKDALLAAWEADCAKAKADGKPEPLKPGPGPGPGSLGTPSGVFNGEIKPVAPYGIRGVVWYQGEQNSGRGFQYRKLLPALITSWRQLWNQGDFPFLIVQMPNNQTYKPDPGSSVWAELREAQTMALSLPNTAMAVTIDAGEEGNVHPLDKLTPGLRLAKIAAKEVYQQPMEDQVYGPTFKSMTVEGDKVRISYDHARGLKSGDGKPLTDFAIAGENRKFVWAEATIEGESVVLKAAGVQVPVAVRYDWADAPRGNLRNGDNLPAAPFRTDDYPAATRNSR